MGATASVSTVTMREKLPDILNEVRYARQRYVITRNGRPIAALVPLDSLEMLDKLDTMLDESLIDERLASFDEGTAGKLEDFVSHVRNMK